MIEIMENMQSSFVILLLLYGWMLSYLKSSSIEYSWFDLSKFGTEKRIVLYKFITQTECDDLIQLVEVDKQYVKQEHTGLAWSPLHSLAEHNLQHEAYNATTRRLILTAYKVRNRIFDFAKVYYQDPNIYIEAARFHLRSSGGAAPTFNNTAFAHGPHVDNCNWDAENDYNGTQCSHNPNTYQRHITAVLYLHNCDGGEFTFFDPDGEAPLPPVPGVLVLFTSGPENPHAVKELNTGLRYNFNMWFSRFPHFNRDLLALHSMVGAPWYSLLDKRVVPTDGNEQNAQAENLRENHADAIQLGTSINKKHIEPQERYIKAWNILQHPAKVQDSAGLVAYLDELGVVDADDLQLCDDVEIAKIAGFLKHIPNQAFLREFGRTDKRRQLEDGRFAGEPEGLLSF